MKQLVDMCFQLRLTSKKIGEILFIKKSTYNFYNDFNALYNCVNEFLNSALENITFHKKNKYISLCNETIIESSKLKIKQSL